MNKFLKTIIYIIVILILLPFLMSSLDLMPDCVKDFFGVEVVTVQPKPVEVIDGYQKRTITKRKEPKRNEVQSIDKKAEQLLSFTLKVNNLVKDISQTEEYIKKLKSTDNSQSMIDVQDSTLHFKLSLKHKIENLVEWVCQNDSNYCTDFRNFERDVPSEKSKDDLQAVVKRYLQSSKE